MAFVLQLLMLLFAGRGIRRDPSRLSRGSLGLFLLLTLPLHAASADIEGVRFADEIEFTHPIEETLSLYGVGLLRYRFVFKGYVAALYLPKGRTGDDVIEDVSRRLELSYFWSIDGDDFAAAADQLLERQLPAPQLKSLRPRVDTLHRAYRDVQPGDRYCLTYFAGVGTELSLNGESLVTIPGADFAKAYFGIWLGPDALDAGLRTALLSGDRGAQSSP